jgi:hypothetical protein
MAVLKYCPLMFALGHKRKQTLAKRARMSALCQKRTHAPQQSRGRHGVWSTGHDGRLQANL